MTPVWVSGLGGKPSVNSPTTMPYTGHSPYGENWPGAEGRLWTDLGEKAAVRATFAYDRNRPE
jgi:hypothetical protein